VDLGSSRIKQTHWATLWRHPCLSRAATSASSQVNPIFCRSLLTVFLQFTLGRPGPLLYPGTSQYNASLLLLLLVWQAPLGVRSTKRRHQSPEWTILSHSYRLIQGEIVRPQVLPSLHPRSTRTSWWSPPVLRRGSSYDTPGICLVWHSCNMAEQRKTPCFDNSR